MEEFWVTPFLEGIGTGAALIMCIGAQNAFVLKQGILKNHVFATAFVCFLIDMTLISLGVGGLGEILTSHTILLSLARWGGTAFLFFYGLRSFRSIFKSESLQLDLKSKRLSLKVTLITALALSLLNPHVYLDTVVLLGSIGAQFPDSERVYFALGAILASFIWFFALAYGARYLAPLFQKPTSWKILDFFIGCLMWEIAISLLI